MSQASRKGLHGQTSLISTHRRQKCTPPPKTSCLIPLGRSLIHERPGGVLPLKPLGEQSCLSCVCLCSKRERDGVCKEGGHERKEVDQKIREEVLCRFSSVWKFRSRSSPELPSGQWKQRDKAPPFLETASCVVPCCIPQASWPMSIRPFFSLGLPEACWDDSCFCYSSWLLHASWGSEFRSLGVQGKLSSHSTGHFVTLCHFSPENECTLSERSAENIFGTKYQDPLFCLLKSWN